ncbi:MAG: YhfC family intramembrane metalloprotease [Clostridiaceae bacterium]|jgi:uncharacterized membrane protein YhfC|nr:YhfC family intramembrane metalloprotease [Clostridiaceae bacterium]
MDYSVPTLSIVFMSVSALTGIVLPIALLIFFRKKHKTGIKPFFIGCATFIVSALIIERIFHSIILNSDIGKMIQGNIWLYGIYGGLMAGLFEETGRFIAFKTVLKKEIINDKNALMYGAGHGGVEVFFILVFSMISNIVMSIMINTGAATQLTTGITNEAQLQAINKTFELLSTTPSGDFLMSIVERIAAVAIHLSLSILVWFAVKKGGKCLRLYPLAIFLHALVDFAVVVLARYVPSMWLVLAVLYVITACFAAIAVKVWKIHSTDNDIEENITNVEAE